ETAAQVAILAAAADGVLDDLPIGAIGPLKDHLGAIIAADPALKAFRDDPSTLTPDLRAALLDCVRAAAGRADKDSAP
ncbi:MAG: hypothetical protein H5U19_14560, partial [Rhodobacteraceae bacterium]|nr:hypothetical protein [Paracoccaceae bacterium]